MQVLKALFLTFFFFVFFFWYSPAFLLVVRRGAKLSRKVGWADHQKQN